MSDSITLLRQTLSTARPCLADAQLIATKLNTLSASDQNRLLQQLIDYSEEDSVQYLLYACALNTTPLNPDLLCQCLTLLDTPYATAPCFALLDGKAIPPLLNTIAATEFSIAQQVFAASIATELTLKYDLPDSEVQKALKKLAARSLAPSNKAIINQLLADLSERKSRSSIFYLNIQVEDLLPKTIEGNIVGGSYTIRRPVEKLGRNEKCHCGSGKKYKKCCYDKDQALLRDASPYAGVTKTDLKHNPGLIDDAAIIVEMSNNAFKNIQPSELGDDQLMSAFQRAHLSEQQELAFKCLLELENRTTKRFDSGHFEDLLLSVLEAGNSELAQRIIAHHPASNWHSPEMIQLRIEMHEHRELFTTIDARLRNAIILGNDTDPTDDPLIDYAFSLSRRFPALAIVFARACIISYPERELDTAMLLEVIHEARADLGLEPWDDPAESLFDWLHGRSLEKQATNAENQVMEDLAKQLTEARAALKEKQKSLQAMQRAAQDAQDKLTEARQTTLKPAPTIQHDAQTNRDHPEQEALIERLRGKVEQLKAEINEQHSQRSALRKQLLSEQKKALQAQNKGAPATTAPVTADVQEHHPEPSGRPLIPEYAEAFRKHCRALPPQIAGKAIQIAGRFAAHDKDIWRQTKTLKSLTDCYRIRIGSDYRLLLSWIPGEELHVLDIIPRQDLEAWIKRHQ